MYTRSDLWAIQYGNVAGTELPAEFARGSALLAGSGTLKQNVAATA